MPLFPMKWKQAIDKAVKNLNISGHQVQLSYIPLLIQKSNFYFETWISSNGHYESNLE